MRLLVFILGLIALLSSCGGNKQEECTVYINNEQMARIYVHEKYTSPVAFYAPVAKVDSIYRSYESAYLVQFVAKTGEVELIRKY